MIEGKGLSIAAFARSYGITQSQLFNWLKSDKPPPIKHWVPLSDYFGVPESYLVSGILEPEIGLVAEGLDDYAKEAERDAAALIHEISDGHARLMRAAGHDLGRLGWIKVQQAQHLSIPTSWLNSASSLVSRIDEAEAIVKKHHAAATLAARSLRKAETPR